MPRTCIFDSQTMPGIVVEECPDTPSGPQEDAPRSTLFEVTLFDRDTEGREFQQLLTTSRRREYALLRARALLAGLAQQRPLVPTRTGVMPGIVLVDQGHPDR